MRESSAMTLVDYIFLISLTILCTDTYVTGEIATRPTQIQQFLSDANYYIKPHVSVADNVNIQLYYECFCPDCRNFDTTQFRQVVLQLNKYLNIQTYPYGNAETIEHNGKYKFKCQHGPGECYGNKLHSCALNIIQNHTEALLYNSCMMNYTQEDKGSDDHAADECGLNMKINSKPIKTCAKSDKGSQLLKHYGDESKKANFQYVPYILVNGKESDGSNFMKDVCKVYTNPPPPCTSY